MKNITKDRKTIAIGFAIIVIAALRYFDYEIPKEVVEALLGGGIITLRLGIKKAEK